MTLVTLRWHPPFFLSSGLPFFTVAITMSPTPAAGSRFSRPLMPFTEMMYRFLAPAGRRLRLSRDNWGGGLPLSRDSGEERCPYPGIKGRSAAPIPG